jgi:thymidylate kinase
LSGKVVVFSGIDGCGKSTQIELLGRFYESRGEKYKTIWVRPGSTPFILALKSFARFFFKSLPKAGRSDQRENLLKTSKIGRLWFYLTFIDLLYIFKIRVPILRLVGYKIIHDRHIFDSIIDYQIMLDRPLLDNSLIKWLLRPNRNIVKIFLGIPIETSIERCNQKWEPFPDTDDEKVERYKIYREHIDALDYIQINGLESPESIHATIVQLNTRKLN